MSAHPKDGGLNVDVSGLLSHWASEFQDSAENSRSAMDRHAHSMHADQFRAAQQQVDKDSDEIDRLRAALWQCFTDAGGDTDGKTDAAGISTDDLISTTTDCVKDLRLGYDEMLDESSEADRLRARVAELETVEAAARVYYEHYMQDEAADEDYCICGLDQHERAKAVRDSLHDLEPFTVKELRL